MLFGNGAEKATDILKNDKATLFSGFIPSAQDLCSMADASFQNEKFEDVAYFEPHYLKAFFSTQKN